MSPMTFGCIHNPMGPVCAQCDVEANDMVEPIAQAQRVRYENDPEWREDLARIGSQIARGQQHNHQPTDIDLEGRPYRVRYDRGCPACSADRTWASERQSTAEDEITESEMRALWGDR